MARLLYVEASPRKDRSISSAATSAFLEAYQAAHPDDVIDILDIWSADLPALDQDALDAKYAGLSGQDRTPSQEAAWAGLKSYADRFRAADKILISVPMWNFGIPYRLKQLIDVDLSDELNAFPYVNGDLFKGHVRTPVFDAAMRELLLDAARFNWSKVSPAIFGSLFQIGRAHV